MKYILLISLLTFNILANNFISDIDLNKDQISVSELKSLVIDHTRKRKSYLSLGESHLQADTVLPLIFEYADLFAQNKNRFDLCAEDIPHTVKFAGFKNIQKIASKTIISAGNNPHKTDFKECNARKNRSKIYYSGFFHQFPFARAYPQEFTQVPVVTEKGNNIWKQNSNDGLFIMMMEMVHLESTASHEVFFNVYDPEELLRKYQALNIRIDALKSSMRPINEESSIFKKKWGYIASSKQLGAIAQKYSPEKAYFIITELDYRKRTNDLHFLKKFVDMPYDFQNKIISISPQSKYLVGTYQTAGKKSDLNGSTGYGTLPYRFELGTSFFQFKVNGQNLLMISEPANSDFRYFNMKNQQEVDYQYIYERI